MLARGTSIAKMSKASSTANQVLVKIVSTDACKAATGRQDSDEWRASLVSQATEVQTSHVMS